MRLSGKHRLFSAGLMAAVLGLAVVAANSQAQNASAPSASQQGSDADVAARVKQALQSDSTLDSNHIDVAVEHGNVVLKGFVQTNHELLVAAQVATKAAGSRKIINDIAIKQNYPNAP